MAQGAKKPSAPLLHLRSSEGGRRGGLLESAPSGADSAGGASAAQAPKKPSLGADSAESAGSAHTPKRPPSAPAASAPIPAERRAGRPSRSPRSGLLRRRGSAEAEGGSGGSAPLLSLTPPRDPPPAPSSPQCEDEEAELDGAPTPPDRALGGWMSRSAAGGPPLADNRRDAEGNTALMRAARNADFAELVSLLGVPGVNVAARNHSGQGAYDLLRRAVSDHSCPEFAVVSQALFLRTMLDLLIREEHFAHLVRASYTPSLPPLTPRGLAKKVLARLRGTYSDQDDDRALPFAAMPSLDFVEAAILVIP